MTRKQYIFSTIILLVVLLFFSVSNPSQFLELSEKEEHFEEESDKSTNDWFYRQRAYPSGKIDKDAYLNAVNFRKDLIRERQIFRENQEWEFAGPTNVGGRVTDIEMHASSMEVIYAAAASGGIFKSEDQGDNWEPIFDDALSLSIGDLDIAETDANVIYVGTGEANAGGGSLAYDGVGVYKTTDAGDSWTHLGLTNVGSIGRVEIDPLNPDRVYVAAMGNLFGNNDERGVYRTEDGGNSWEQVLFVSDSTGAIDLAIHPTNGDIIYAAMWERIRRPTHRQYGGATSGIYRSMDGGDTWQELTDGLPTDGALKGRIGLGISKSDPDILYALYATQIGAVLGTYLSEDGGDTWTLTEGVVGGPSFAWWFGKIEVDPTNSDRIFLANLNMRMSLDGGASWPQTFNGVHVDQHAAFIHPSNPNFVVIGNDGGVYTSFDGGANWQFKNTLPITQFYTCEIDFSQPEQLYGGSQDNGTQRTTTGNLADWQLINGGDGFVVRVNPVNPDIIYAEFQNGWFSKSIDGGLNFDISLEGVDSGDRNNWNTPYVLDPSDPDIMYLGTHRIYKSIDGGSSWNPISPDLTDGDQGSNLTFGTVTTIDVSPIDDQIIYVGTDDGNVWVTFDGGGSWDNITADLPKRWVTRVATDPQDDLTAYVTISGYRFDESFAHVYATFDGGFSWTDLGGNLPDVPVNDIIVDPFSSDYLYIATDVGVFWSENGGGDWDIFGLGLPNVPITDLTFHQPTRTLLAATYGRSMYKIDLLDFFSPVPGVEEMPFALKAFPNPFNERFEIELKGMEKGQLEVDLFDAVGRKVKTVFSGEVITGEQSLLVSGDDLIKGVYFLKVEIGGEVYHLKMVKQ